MEALGWIVLANVLATVVSIALAAWLSFRFPGGTRLTNMLPVLTPPTKPV